MSQRRAQTRSGRISDPSSDKANRSVSDSPFNPSEEWSGGQVDRAPWLNRLLHIAEGSFEYITLTRTATVSMAKGSIAVFSIEHAKEHLATTGIGTFRAPNMRLREDLSQMYNAPPATTPALQPMSHGGYPLTLVLPRGISRFAGRTRGSYIARCVRPRGLQAKPETLRGRHF